MQLLLISLIFIVAERLIPWRREQHAIRTGSLNDLFHFVFNGYLFYMVYSIAVGYVFAFFTELIRSTPVDAFLNTRLLTGQPIILQFIVLFLVQDFVMWSTHNLLHRLPWLWEFHKVHHSIETMDWVGNMRYHWGEIVVYDLMRFVPMTILGAEPILFVYIGIFNTVIGHFNHANVAVDLGPMRYVFNSPRMHLWHHDKSGPGSYNKNFAIGLSVWDWLFGTAYYPKPGEPEQPEALGFPGIENYPKTFIGQQLYPLSKAWKGRALYSIALMLLLSAATVYAQGSGLRIDTAARSVTFTAHIYPSRFNAPSSTKNHHFIVWKGGSAAKNALIESDVNDLEIQRALESLGGHPGNNLTLDTWNKRADSTSADPDLRVRGSIVDVSVIWSGHAPVRASDIFVDHGGHGFDFHFGGHEQFIRTWKSGCVVCLESCPGGRVSNARYTIRDLYDGTARFDIDRASLPPDGTLVSVTLKLLPTPSGPHGRRR